MNDVNASSVDVRRLGAALRRYEQDVKQVSRRVEGAIRAANWHDRKKEQFEIRYRDFQKGVDRFMSSQVQEMVRSLNDLAQKLEEIERMKM